MSKTVLTYVIRSQYMLAITQPSECSRAERKAARQALRLLAARARVTPKEARQIVLG